MSPTSARAPVLPEAHFDMVGCLLAQEGDMQDPVCVCSQG